MTRIACTCLDLPMGPGQTCNAHQLSAVGLIYIPADDLRVGDVIVHDGGETLVRDLDRCASPTIATNPGSRDQISGYLWEHVAVRREEQM